MQGIVRERAHSLSVEETIAALGTDIERGLDLFDVETRQQRFGANRLTRRAGRGPIVRFLLQFHQPLVYVLVVAALVTAALREWVDAAVIFGIVLINAVIGFVQEAKALSAIDALSATLPSDATVIRDAKRMRIPAAQLTPGDVVLLGSGDRVPADLRLVKTRELRVDESALTGESVSVTKTETVLPEDTPLTDRKNIAYSSALVTYGTATGIVIGIGDDTELGQISEMLASVEDLRTPLTRRLDRFSKILLGWILVLAAVMFAVGMLRGWPFFDTFMAAVALAVGAIPEGLPAAVTVILAIGVSRMARRQAIIRRLPAVETLGSTTIICSDKTGTLTRNEMTVQEVYAAGRCYQVTGIGYAPDGAILNGQQPADLQGDVALRETLLCGLLCNDSSVVESADGWRIEGDPTEAALLVAAAKARLEPDRLPRLDTVPFESQHQYMATLHLATLHEAEEGAHVVYVKGALEAILGRSTRALRSDGSLGDLDPEAIQREAESLASRGRRVLALATKALPADRSTLDHDDVAGDLVFLGLQAMIDPPRPEAVQAIATCHAAGIEVKMITGDHAVTALAIAREMGIVPADAPPDEVRTGKELARISDAELIAVAGRAHVFARVSPEHKLRLVHALQAAGHVVAMTGDGVNDAPALRRADIGIAMGRGGTEVAREASDMVLTNDDFASIEAAVEEGRGVFDNLMKFIVWTLPTNGGEALVVMAAVLLGTALPILPVQILWINMTTAGLLGLLLAFEPKERDLMQRLPRDPAAPILDGVLLARIIAVSLLLSALAFGTFKWELTLGLTEAQARTTAVAVFVSGELFYLFNCRSLTRSMFSLGFTSNPWLFLGVGVMTLVQLFFTYSPAMNTLFQSEPIPLRSWLHALAAGLLVYSAIGIEKWVRRQLGQVGPERVAAAR